jgi:hypothetical protein
MARNNLTWIKGDITGDIYYDIFHLEAKDVQYLRLYLMVQEVAGAVGVKGLRVCVRLFGRVDIRSCTQRQPPGGDRTHPAALKTHEGGI